MAFIHLTHPSEHVAQIRIDVPPRNALSDAARTELLETLDKLAANEDIRAVILTGTAKAFCAGDDIREVATRGDTMSASLASFARLFDLLEAYRVPVIAAVNGYAFGGGLELALSCDIRIAADSASFAGAGVNVGLMASVYRLPRLIGIARAKAMLLTGLPVDAETALDYGLVTAVHPYAGLDAAALTLAARIATRAPLSVEAAKRQIGRAFDMTPDEAKIAGGKEVVVLRASADHKAAVEAFLNKKEPVFTRR